MGSYPCMTVYDRVNERRDYDSTGLGKLRFWRRAFMAS